jgi:hypothetical protein
VTENKNTRAYRQGIAHERERIVRILSAVKWLKPDEREALIDAVKWISK